MEILALKLRHDPDCKGIMLPNPREPFLSYDGDKNNEENFFSKISKMKTKLHLWQTRSLTARSFNAGEDSACLSTDLCSINFNSPWTCDSENTSWTFRFLWRTKKHKIKRKIIYQPISDGGLNFMNFQNNGQIVSIELDR